MKNSTMIRFIFLFSFLHMVLIGGSQSLQVKLASDEWPPFTDLEGQQAIALSLVEEALQRGDIEIASNILDFTDVLKGIREGEFDGSAALWRSSEREEFLLYSDAYLENRLILVGRKGVDVSASKLSELKGKRVGLVQNYAYGAAVDTLTTVEFVPGRNDQINLGKLLKGEVDYILVDHLLIQYLLEFQAIEAYEYLEVGAHPLFTRTLHFAVRKDLPKAAVIIEQFNSHVKEMVADGTYNRILQLNWIRMDVDDDGQLEMILAGNEAGTEAPILPYDVPSKGGDMVESGPANRYVIDGETYEGWDNVPEKYKVSSEPAEEDLKEERSSVIRFRWLSELTQR